MQLGESYIEKNLSKELGNIKQETKLSPLEEGLLNKYDFSDERNQIDDFRDVYSEEKIVRDKDILLAAKGKARKEDELQSDVDSKKEKRRGKLFESLFFHSAEKNKWFGDDFELMPSCEYDDWINHVDFILEANDVNHETMRIGIDVTTSVNGSAIVSKINQVNAGQLNKVDYFQSSDGTINGKCLLPRVVVGISPETLSEFAEDVKWNRANESIVQIMILDEMKRQILEFFKLSIEANGKESNITIELRKINTFIDTLLEKKENLRPIDFDAKVNDITFSLLR